jgi:hypothetical protein
VVAAPQVRVVLGCQREGQGRPARYRRGGGAGGAVRTPLEPWARLEGVGCQRRRRHGRPRAKGAGIGARGEEEEAGHMEGTATTAHAHAHVRPVTR